MNEPVTVADVGPFESASALQEAHGRLLEEFDRALGDDASSEAELAALSRLEPEIRTFLERGAATGIYLEDVKERTAAQVLLDYWVSSLAQAALGAPAARLVAFDGDRLPDLRDKRCPYVGLDAFRGPEFFYGRDRDIAEFVTQLLATPLVVVVGASGSGKSSLVMGGVLPVLAGPQVSVRFHVVPPIVPRGDVFAHLAAAIFGGDVTGTGTAAAAAQLRSDPGQLTTLLEGVAGDRPALLVIDQFEEVFTLTEDEQPRTMLAEALASLLASPRGHRAILTMREEFRSRLVQLRALGHLLDRAWYSMRPMGYDELTAAVERPAAVVNLQFQPGIVDDLVKRVLGQPAALPLLQFTLRMLWDRRRRNRITWEVYRDVGDPLTALDSTASDFIDGLVPEMQDEAKRVLLELVRVDELLEAYRQPVPKARLLEAGRANTPDVLRILEQHEFIRISREDEAEIVEVKHESLVRNWRRFVAWIDEKRIARRQRLALSQAAARWAERGRPAEGLLTGWQLEEARRQQDLDALEREFVATSAQRVEEEAQQQISRARRSRLLAWAITVVLLVLMVALFFQRRAAEDARKRAEGALGRAHTQEAARLVDAGRPDQALAHLAHALRTDPESVAARSWVSSLLLVEPLWIPGAPIEHQGAVSKVALSPDGGRMITVVANAVHVRETTTGKSIGRLLDHTGDVASVAFSPDGQHVLTASDDGTAHVWDLASLAQLAVLKHDGPVRTALFAPDGRHIVTASGDTARVWDGLTGRPVGRPLRHADNVFMAAFSPDGRRVVTASGRKATVWDVQLGRATGWTVEHTDLVFGAAFSPDGRRVVTASYDDTARVWDAETRAQLLQLTHLDDVVSARFSASGDWILTASADNTARIWEVDTGRPIGGPLRHDDRLADAQMLGDGRVIVTASGSQARVWESIHPREASLLLDHPARLRRAAFSADGRRLVTASEVSAHVWDPATGKEMFDHHLQPEGGIAVVAFTRDARRLVAGADNRAGVWEIGPARQVILPVEHTGSVRAVAFSPDGARIATASDDTTARVWDAATGRAIGPALQHPEAVVHVDFSPDGLLLITVSEDGVARLWDVATGAAARPTMQHEESQGEIASASFSPDGRRVVTVSPYGGTARVWDAVSGTAVGQPLQHRSSIASATFSPDGRRLATASADGTARIWDASTGARMGDPLVHGAAVTSAVFSNDGRRVLTASHDGTARMWDAETGHPAGAPLRHRFALAGAAFSPDGRQVATSTDDTVARLWPALADPVRRGEVDPLSDVAELAAGLRVTPLGSVVPLTDDERRERVGRVLGPRAPLHPSAQALLARVRQGTR